MHQPGPGLAFHQSPLVTFCVSSGRYCQSACNDCTGSCPQNVAIAEVLRTRMYDVD